MKDISAFPGEAEYEEGIVVYNQAYIYLMPAFVSFPRTVYDVQRCLQCSAMHAMPCVVKSGGHCNSGYSTIGTNGFVINLEKMNDVRVGSNTVVVQTGSRWKNVYDKLEDKQLIMGGMCPFVGVGGYTLGGGYSILSRKYGLAIDNVISMTMVTANGDGVVTANATMNSDLFWAMRGGGGGNFGIVTDITFKFHAADYHAYILGSLSFGNKSQQALSLLGRINSQLPREMYLDFIISSYEELHVASVYLGMYEHALEILKPLTDMASNVSFSTFNSYYSLAYKLAADSGINAHTSGESELLRGCIFETLDEKLVQILFNFDIQDGCLMKFNHLGGAIADVKPEETAYYHRNAPFNHYILCKYPPSEEKETIKYADGYYDVLEQSGYCSGNYVNDMDYRLGNWKEKYYGANYQRLLKIKNIWNPVTSGYFHFPQEIGSNDTIATENIPSEL